MALIPYFGGIHGAAHSERNNRPGYLKRTVDSLQSFAEVIFVGVQPEEDLSVIPDGAVPAVLPPVDPPLIPAGICDFGREQHDFDLVYYTEADQVLHYDPEILSTVSGRQYLSPHRLEQLISKDRFDSGTGGFGTTSVEFEGNHYVLANGHPHPDCELYKPHGIIASFGGAWLASAELFRSADLTSGHIEDISGFHLSHIGECRKTGDWRRFFVEHLSGFDHIRRQAGMPALRGEGT